MKARHALLLAAVSSIGAAGLVHGIQAQPKPPVYYVAELEVLNPDALTSIKAAGGRYLVRGTNITGLEGTPPRQMVILAWDDMNKLKAWYDGPYKDLRPLRDNAHKSVRAYAVEGIAN